jgi:cytochrome d ubiquinol oxidase subunit II
VLAPLLLGIALAGTLHGLPVNSSQNYTGSFADLFQGYSVFTGVTLLALCALHGATFLSLKTTGDMHRRARQLARSVAPVTCALVIGFAIWTHVAHSTTFFVNPVELLTILAAIAALLLVYAHHDGWAFTATTVTIAAGIVSIFTALYPNVIVSSTNAAYNLTVSNTASPSYSLKVMTVVVVVLLPVVLAYQAWSYYVFRRRVSRSDFQPAEPPTPSPTTKFPAVTTDGAPPPARHGA